MNSYDHEWAKDVDRRLIALETKTAVSEVSKTHMDAKFDELKDEIKELNNSFKTWKNWLLGIFLTPLATAVVLFIIKGGLQTPVPGVN